MYLAWFFGGLSKADGVKRTPFLKSAASTVETQVTMKWKRLKNTKFMQPSLQIPQKSVFFIDNLEVSIVD